MVRAVTLKVVAGITDLLTSPHYLYNTTQGNNMRKGFTILELLMVLWALFVLCIIGGVIYVACHFIAKFW